MPVIRSAGLRGFRSVVAELGGDAEALAARAGLPSVALDADDLMVSGEALAMVLEMAAAELSCPDLALRMADRQELSMLGPLALAIQNSATLADAMECTSRYLFLHAPPLVLALEDDPLGRRGVASLRYGTLPGLPEMPQATELGLAFVHRAIGSLVGDDYRLHSVELAHRPAAPIARLEEFFGAPVRTGRDAARLRIPARLRDARLPGADAETGRLALAYLARLAKDEHVTLPLQVELAIGQLLGVGGADVASVARLLSLHPRTLQRRLAADGTTYAAILDGVRRDTARQFLTGSDMPMSQIAAAVGLSEQSALTRSCRRWFGLTPREVRDGS